MNLPPKTQGDASDSLTGAVLWHISRDSIPAPACHLLASVGASTVASTAGILELFFAHFT